MKTFKFKNGNLVKFFPTPKGWEWVLIVPTGAVLVHYIYEGGVLWKN